MTAITLLSLLLPAFLGTALASPSGTSLGKYQPYFRCGECVPARCPELHYCEGKVIKDHCGCCDECSNRKFQPHLVPTTPAVGGDACEQLKCPKFKVCMKNIQGLPLCSCPSPNLCDGNKKKKNKKKEVCGTDGKTYPSKCHMRLVSCNTGVAVRKQYKGACTQADSIKATASYKRKLKRIRRKRRRERRREKGEEEAGGKKKKKRQRRKRRRRRRKSGSAHKKNRAKRRQRRNHRFLERTFSDYKWMA